MAWPSVSPKWKSDSSKSFNYTQILIRVIQSSTCPGLSWSLHSLIHFRCLWHPTLFWVPCSFLLWGLMISVRLYFCQRDFVQTVETWQRDEARTKVVPGRLIFLIYLFSWGKGFIWKEHVQLFSKNHVNCVYPSKFPLLVCCHVFSVKSGIFSPKINIVVSYLSAGCRNHLCDKPNLPFHCFLRKQPRTEVQKNSSI